MKQEMKHDIIIVGAGLAGLSLALALSARRRRVLLLDAKPAPVIPAAAAEYDQRIYAISPMGAAWLREVRAWPAMDASRMTPVYDMHIHGDAHEMQPFKGDGLQGDGLHLSAYRAGVSELCTIVEERAMQRVLLAAVGFAPGVEVLRPVEAASLRCSADADAATLTLADGRAFEASLIIAADGARSWVREQAGIAIDDMAYEHAAVVANFHTEKPHFNCASQWFREEAGGASILAWLPLPGNQISIVWSVPDAMASELLTLTPQALADRVATAGSHQLGALTLASQPASFSLRNQRARALIAPRVALVGDAAHVVHPLAGQGLNLGFGDCAELVRAIDGAPDLGAHLTLRRYERARKAAILEMHGVTHGLQRLFAAQSPLLRTLRNAGLNFTGRLPVLPQWLVQHATRTL